MRADSSKRSLRRAHAELCPVRVERLRKGWSQVELSRRCGLTQQQIALLESGRTTDPKLSSIVALTKALGMSLVGFVSAWLRWRELVETVPAEKVAEHLLMQRGDR